MSDKFGSIGINIEEGERNISETVQDDFADIQGMMDDFIKGIFELNEESKGEEFFNLVHDYCYENKGINEVIASVEELFE